MKHRLASFISLVGVLLFCPQTLLAQTARLAALARNYTLFSQSYAQEKVYLHFDNDSYFIGENIWFKAYVVLAENHHYTPMSKTLYVELLSAGGHIIESLKLPIDNGQAHGVFYLKPELSAGFYEVRAYTRCMLNFGQEVVFSRVFPVFDQAVYERRSGRRQTPTMKIAHDPLPDKRAKPTDKSPDSSQAIAFYPEGGHLIEGLPNQIAFKAWDPAGREAEVSGQILDSQGRIATAFATAWQGMGFFEFTPQPGEHYTCQLQRQGKTFTATLPEVEPQGYALRINNLLPDQIGITVLNNFDRPQDTIALAVACRGRLYLYQPLAVTANTLTGTFSKAGLPSGVNEVFIYDSEGRILASRMIFVRNPQQDPAGILIDYEQNKATYKAFEPITMKFSLQQRQGEDMLPLGGQSFSLAVRDASEVLANARQTDAYSELLLASDLKGYIKDPAFYFEKDDQRHRQLLDLLMMVQGWRRYRWEVMSGQQAFTPRHPIEEGILVDGRILSIIRRTPVPDVKVTLLMLSDSAAYSGACTTDNDGNFNFLYDFQGEWKLTLQVTDQRQQPRNVFISLNRHFQPNARAFDPVENDPPVLRANQTQAKSRTYQDNYARQGELHIMPGDVLLQEAEVTAKRKQRNEEYGQTVSITYEVKKETDKMQDQAQYTNDDLFTFLTGINEKFWIQDVFNETTSAGGGTNSVPSQHLYYQDAPVKILNTRTLRLYESLSDELPFVDQIEKIEVLEPGVKNIALENGFNLETLEDVADMGKRIAYVLITPYADGHSEIPQVGIRHTVIQGYNQVKDFYHPRYDRAFDTDPFDHRRTLYWNPDLKTDDKGEVSIRFYNNADPGNVSAHAQVVTAQGQTGSLDR